MSVKNPASWTVHALSTRPGMPSGPTALQIFTRLKDRIFDGFPEIVTDLFRSSIFPDLKAYVLADKAVRTSLLIHGFWLG